MKELALYIPGVTGSINAPVGVPQGIGLNAILKWGILFFIVISIVTALFFIIWAGIKWITSGGDKQKIQGARQTITFAVIGIILIFLSYFIIGILGSFFGVNLLNNTAVSRTPNCPDGSGEYTCGVTSDTSCTLCSPLPDCSTQVHSIASCSSGVCHRDEDCDLRGPVCPPGQTAQMACLHSGCVLINDCH